MSKLAKNIERYRLEAGMTQTELAEKLDVPQSSISRWERGTRKPEAETIARIVRALGITADELLEGV